MSIERHTREVITMDPHQVNVRQGAVTGWWFTSCTCGWNGEDRSHSIVVAAGKRHQQLKRDGHERDE